MSQPTGLILPKRPRNLPYTETMNPFVAGSAQVHGANYAYFVRVRSIPSIAALKVYIGTQSGNIDLGVYRSDDNGTTLVRLASLGSTGAGTGTSVQTGTLAVNPPDDDCWLALAVDNGTVTLWRTGTNTAISAEQGGALMKASSFPLPASVSSLSGSNYCPWIRAVP